MITDSSKASGTDSVPAFDARVRYSVPAVLLAEDNSINAELLAMTARRLGVEVTHAVNGQEAVELAQRARDEDRPFSLVLMDVMMPVMDGIKATRALRLAGFSVEELPIVAVTAAASSVEVRSYIAAGMQACLCKPVLRDELKAVFDTWLPNSIRTEGVVRDQPAPSLQERYEKRKADTLQRIETALAARDLQPETIEEIRNLVHKLAGTAGSFGEAALSEAATQCEVALIAATPDRLYATLVDGHERLLRVA
jgi:CheY-like chemotaxis protein